MNVLLTYRSTLALFSFFVLGITLAFSRGQYDTTALYGVVLALGSYALAVWPSPKRMRLALLPRSSFFLLALIAVLFAAILGFEPNIIYPQSKALHTYFANITRLVTITVGVFLLFQLYRPLADQTTLRWLAVLLAGLLYLRFFVLSLSPAPHIDVFAVINIGCDYFLSGLNPYNQSYPEIYGGAYQNPFPPCLPYGPVYLYLVTPFRLLHEIRLVAIVADALTVAAIWRIGAVLGWNVLTRSVFALLWLVFPVSLFVLEQAWVDPVLVAAVAWSFSFLLENKLRSLGIALGLVCGIKLYGLVAAFFIVLHLWRNQGLKPALQISAWSAGLLVVTYLPFAVINLPALFHSTWTSLVTMSPRADALTLWAWLLDQFSVPQPRSGTLIISALPIGVVLWKFWRSEPSLPNLTRSLVLAFSALFFFGSQAFCNYYYFLAFLLFLDLIFSLAADSEKTEADSVSAFP